MTIHLSFPGGSVAKNQMWRNSVTLGATRGIYDKNVFFLMFVHGYKLENDSITLQTLLYLLTCTLHDRK